MPTTESVYRDKQSRSADPVITEHEGTTELFIPEGVLPVWLAGAIQCASTGDIRQALQVVDSQGADGPWWTALESAEARGYAAFVTACIYLKGLRALETGLWFDRACEHLSHPLILNEAARFFSRQGRRDKSISLRRLALKANPGNGFIRATLGDDLICMGRKGEGFRLIAQALRLQPDNAVIRSLWLSNLHYQEELDREQLFQEHRQWGLLHGKEPIFDPVSVVADPERQLRIGYVSSDFHRHSVSYFFESLLDARSREDFTVVGYGNVSSPDSTTERLAGKFNIYRNILGMEDTTAAALIHKDQVDILVDLGGHFGGNRLGVFTRKPAPVQVTYLGYPDSTGLSQIDYRLTDTWADDAEAQSTYSESLWYLSSGFLCYRPAAPEVPIGPLPALHNGYVTLGSFNNNCKITEGTLQLWSRILLAVPNSRLVLKFKEGDLPELQQRYVQTFTQRGIASERIEVWGWRTRESHLQAYNFIDIALDTYPYHGTTTTCEALWMGVPVVTLCGVHHASRVGLSLLNQVGLPHLVAQQEEDYVNMAVALCGQLENLSQLRRTLRSQMLQSSLCDARRLARDVEAAFRGMWYRWCEKQHR
ncbi:hypothetical protein ACFL6U_28885 [Planctomycetota bacterium]